MLPPNDTRGFIHKRIGRGLRGFGSGGLIGAASGFFGRGEERVPRRGGPGGTASPAPRGSRGRQRRAEIAPPRSRSVPFALPRLPTRVVGGVVAGHRIVPDTGQRGGPRRFGPASKASRRMAARALAAAPMEVMEAGMMIACPQGYHPNKSGYYTQEGYIEEGSRCVKNRRRNALNPRALTRAVGRIKSAKTASKILGRITIRKHTHD